MTELRKPPLRGCFCCGESDAVVFRAKPARLHARRRRAGADGRHRRRRASAQTADAKPFRIDVHHHLSPPTYVTASNESGFGDALMKNWTIEKTLADMDKAGIATAMLSVTTPGVNFTKGDPARRLCREANEYAAKLVADYPGRFGNFAMLPLTDAEGSLREIAYALDTLKADGIALMTSYGDKWLGDPLFLPVMEELNRRKALVYTHPTAANCCVNLVPTQQPVMIEFGTDTTRTIADIVFSGNARRFPDIRWIFSHAGGTMPFLIERFVRNPLLDPKAKAGRAGRNARRAEALLLRHRADGEQERDVGADSDHSAVADRVRNRLSVPDRNRSCEGIARGWRVHG